MVQTKRFFSASLGAAATGTIALFDKSGAKISILAITGSNGGFGAPMRVTLRDSSRSYELIVAGAPLIFPAAYDIEHDRYKTPIELEGNVIFEVTNDTAAALASVEIAVLYNIQYAKQKA